MAVFDVVIGISILIVAYYHLPRSQCLYLTLHIFGSELIMFIRRQARLRIKRVSRETRIKWTVVALRIFQVIFTYYRLTRMLLLLTLKFMSNKLTWIVVTRIRKYTKKHSQVEESSKWSKQMAEDIMQLILQRLCISDYLRCRAVCLSWRAAIDVAIASKCCPPAPQLPWLMLGSHWRSVKDHSFVSLSDQKVYKSNPANYINRRHCVGSIEGWLVMVDSDFLRPEGFGIRPWKSFYSYDRTHYHTTINYFLNPISGTRVLLPSQSTIPCSRSSRPFFLEKVVVSSVPTSPQSCIVAGLCSEGRYLAFCRPTDKSWTLIHVEEELRFRDIEIIERKLYGATRQASEFLMVFEIEDGSPPRYKAEKLVMLHPRPLPSTLHNRTTRDGVVYQTKKDVTYLAKDPTLNELFMIFRRISFAYEEDPIIPWSMLGGDYVVAPKTEGFRVFKLECNNVGTRWVQVSHLGDRILFLSRGSNKFISSSSLETAENNCIYFGFDYPCSTSPSTGTDFGIFSFTNNNLNHFILPKGHTSLQARTTWFTPNL